MRVWRWWEPEQGEERDDAYLQGRRVKAWDEREAAVKAALKSYGYHDWPEGPAMIGVAEIKTEPGEEGDEGPEFYFDVTLEWEPSFGASPVRFHGPRCQWRP